MNGQSFLRYIAFILGVTFGVSVAIDGSIYPLTDPERMMMLVVILLVEPGLSLLDYLGGVTYKWLVCRFGGG